MDTKEDNKSEMSFSFIRGSDPRAATCRGKLQNRRCKLNQEINKELRLRAGAENLFKATTNKKLKETVALELSFVNSNLQLLKEQLSELNSSVEIYQNESLDYVIPMVPMGLKETKEVNFMEPFSDFILEHYSEDSMIYEDSIADITDTRQAAKTPTRDAQGVSLLFRYYNLLYYVERRFFPPDRSLGVYFEWYDSLTGVPSCQRTVAFEKACILFNLAAIYTQIGAKQDRSSEKGLDAAVDNFLRAAGVFKHIYDTFTNAPSMDLKPQVLEVLVALTLAQARECLFEKLKLQIDEMTITESWLIHRDLSGEATQLAMEYNEIHRIIQSNEAHTYLPECWAGLVPLKSEYYKALAHYHTAKSIDPNLIQNQKLKKKSPTQKDTFIFDESSIIDDDVNPIQLKKAHLRESQSSHEEAQRLQRMCRELKNKMALTKVLQYCHMKTKEEIELLEIVEDKNSSKFIDEDIDLIDVVINATSKFTISLTGPDFTAYKVEDPFKKLGPIAVFSARRYWTAPRNIRLQKGSTVLMTGTIDRRRQKCQCNNRTNYYNDNRTCDVCQKDISNANDHTNEDDLKNPNSDIENYGFHVRGDAPVLVSYVEINSLADLGGIKEGDFIVEIAGIDVKWYTCQQLIKLVKSCGNSLDLKVITPMDRNYLKPMSSTLSKGSVSTLSGSSSGVSSGAPSPTGTASKPRSKLSKNRLSSFTSNWNPFRRTHSLGKIFQIIQAGLAISMMPQPRKKVKLDDSRLFVKLTNPQGEEVAQQLELSKTTTREELQQILNQLIRQGDEEDMLFSFFHNNIELTDTLKQLCDAVGATSSEGTLDITYHPQSLFRIRPITRQTAALEGHEQPILASQFRNQGDVAITASGDTTIRLWDIETETPVHTFEGHTNWVLCLAWSPNGKYFVSGGMDNNVCIWDYSEQRMIGKPLKGHTKWITSVAWEPLHLNPECALVASSSKDGTVRLWSRVNNCCLLTISAHQKCITKMLYSGTGHIYTASEDTTAAIWSKNGHKVQELKGHGHWVNTIASSVDFILRTGCFSEDAVRKNIEFESGEQMAAVAKERYHKALAGKGERLVSGSDDCTLFLWEPPRAKPVARMTGHQQPVNHVQFSPDGRYIVSASFDKSLRVWDGYKGTFICKLFGHVGAVYQVAWSSDSRLLLSGSKDSTLKVWSLRQQKLLFDLPGHADEVYAVDWAPVGGEKAISGGKDKRVKIWRH